VRLGKHLWDVVVAEQPVNVIAVRVSLLAVAFFLKIFVMDLEERNDGARGE
jgi:hypothetical protein